MSSSSDTRLPGAPPCGQRHGRGADARQRGDEAMRSKGAWWAAPVLALSLGCPPSAGSEDGLEAARRLYAAAAYEEALKTLEGLKPAASDAKATVAVEQQRLLCLVALGRPADAEGAMTAIVQADPLYLPDASAHRHACAPRSRTCGRGSCRALQSRSTSRRGRRSTRADYAAASAGFARVVAIVEPSDGAGADPVLRDVAVLATGFKTLSDKADAAPPAPAAAPPRRRQRRSPPRHQPRVSTTQRTRGSPSLRSSGRTCRSGRGAWSPPNRDAVLES